MSQMRVETIKEHEYLIARGVRALALIGNCPSDEISILRAITKIESCGSGQSIPFILDRGDGTADFGYATHQWVIELYKLAIQVKGPIPERQRACIIGLLLGYNPESIARFTELQQCRIQRGD